MKLPRRRFLHLAAGAAALPAMPRVARAQAYPTRPITMIVPFAPGGISDVMGRMMAEPLRAILGQPIIIENVGGAAGSIGVGRAVRAPGDGYTLSIGTTSLPGQEVLQGWPTPAIRHIDLEMEAVSNFLQQVRAGNLKAYAVAGKARLATAPDIPTVDEAGLPGF